MKDQFDLVVVGHVDHGKSTVIGRLLADTGSLPDGKLEQVRAECARSAKPFEYAFLLDALKAEQSQGITIDTARSFFKSQKRHYIIIDAPGHIEFLKNMVTGAARAEGAILVIDAKEGVKENSRRHGYMLSLLGIKQVVVAVNKMDLAEYSQEVFDRIEDEYRAFLKKVGIVPAAVVPLAAFHGENLVTKSAKMPWYTGLSLLDQMDQFRKEAKAEFQDLRLPVQDVYKFTEEGDDRRIIAGRVETGYLKVGDEVSFFPSLKKAKIKTLEEFNRDSPESFGPGKSCGFTLEPEIYVRPGELMAKNGETAPKVGTRFKVNIFWMGRTPFQKGRKYKIKLHTAESPVWLEEIRSVLDASDLVAGKKDRVDQYEVGECVLEAYRPLAFDLSHDLAGTGRFVIVDGFEIAGGGIILEDLGSDQIQLQEHLKLREKLWDRSKIARERRERRLGHGSAFVLLTGPTGSPLGDLGRALEERLFEKGRSSYFLGAANAGLGLGADLGTQFSSGATEDRSEQVRRIGEVAHLFTDAGNLFITAIPELEPREVEILIALASPAPVYVIQWEKESLVEGVFTLDAGDTLEQKAEGVEKFLANQKHFVEWEI